MLSFDSRKRPTVAQILQQRFIRDRIKIFLQKQRPNSGKNSRNRSNNPPGGAKADEKVPQKPPRTNISSSSVETDFDTMQVEVKSKRSFSLDGKTSKELIPLSVSR